MSKNFKVLYRPHRGALQESLNELKEFNTIEDLLQWLCDDYFRRYGKKKFSLNDINISYYCYDSRINWNTYLVTIDRFGSFDFLRHSGTPRPIGFMTFKYLF